ncbi:MAG TPA: hypothetical protein VG323_02895 [Thermoanaerobaculia bacterium]|nr:hypothetical protein [Thermoanaerobaculia bacterium]
MRKLSIVAALLLVAACASGRGNHSGVLGSPSPNAPSTVTGTVNFVDPTAQRIDLNVSTVNDLRASRDTASIYYDNHTQVLFAGRNYAPSQLERGDQVSVHGYNDSGRYVADTINVTKNVRQ